MTMIFLGNYWKPSKEKRYLRKPRMRIIRKKDLGETTNR